MIGRIIGSSVLKIIGWKVLGTVPVEKKYIIIEVPHTSNWDFFLGLLGVLKLGVKTHFLIKKEWFFFPFGSLLKGVGGLPVDRNRSVSLVDNLVNEFDRRENFSILITPEGTRKRVTRWKHGFLFIARNANVPIYLGYVNYKRKELSVGKRFVPSQDERSDMKEITAYYRELNLTPKHPELFALESVYDE